MGSGEITPAMKAELERLGNSKDSFDLRIATQFMEKLMISIDQILDMLKMRFSMNAILEDNTSITSIALYSDLYISYAVDRALKVITFTLVDREERTIDYFDSQARKVFRDNMFMSNYDIARMHRLYNKLIAAFKEGRRYRMDEG
jgi:hypothetical protein